MILSLLVQRIIKKIKQIALEMRRPLGMMFCRGAFFLLFDKDVQDVCRLAVIRVSSDPHVPHIVRENPTLGWNEASEQARTWAKAWKLSMADKEYRDSDIHLGIELYYYAWVRDASSYI